MEFSFDVSSSSQSLHKVKFIDNSSQIFLRRNVEVSVPVVY